jgi:lipid-A-disaccharide synthase
MSDTVMIVSGETSGELYGGLLASSLRGSMPGVRITGIGGQRMKDAGVELIAGISSAFGLAEVLSSLKEIRRIFRKAVAALDEQRPSVLVLIDYPDFNLRLAAEAKKRGIKVLYYVSPQVWAWRRGRVKKIVSLVDRMAVVLPFEEEIYRGAGLECEFVGHPVWDEIRGMRGDKAGSKEGLGLRPDRPLISLLPGSRPGEIGRLLPVLTEVVREWRKAGLEEFQFAVPLAPNTDPAQYDPLLRELRKMGVLVTRGESLKTLAASDLAVVASGTASFQAVLLGVPMVVIYRLFPLTYWLGRLIVKVKHISLVNILAGKQVVKELIQAEAAPAKITSELRTIMDDGNYRSQMLQGYDTVRKMFEKKDASSRVAEIIAEMA